MTREEGARAGLLSLIEDLTVDADDPLGDVVAARILQEQLPEVLQTVLQTLVDKARARGASWQDLATALGLKAASSAHWHYGKGRPEGDTPRATKEDRLEALRSRATDTRTPRPPAPELPGLTRKAAAERMGCDPKTVASRAAKMNGVRAETFLAPSGKSVSRYFVI